MAISDLLNRRVRAQADDDEIEEEEEVSGASASEGEDEEDVASGDQDDERPSDDDMSDGSEDDEDDENNEEPDEDGNEDLQSSLNNISFGALAKAQSSFGPRKNKRTKFTPAADEQKDQASPLDDIRARIREAREQKRNSSNPKTQEKERARENRTSKHAPMVQSTKHAVSRKRTIIEPNATISRSRDPRFDPTIVGNKSKNENAYAFLNDYRASELNNLKQQLARTKNAEQKEALKKSIRSASDKLREIESRRREKEVLSAHKTKEKEAIREGKKSNPYYLKKSELKQQVLKQKYEGMNSRDRGKALERRRKKMASKERLAMPAERRVASMGDEDGGRKKKRA